MPKNSVVEMAFAHPNDGQYAIGCNLDSADLSSMYWWIGDGGGNVYPTIIPGEPDYHVLSTPLTGTHQLVCGVNASGGDGRLFSYRVMPPWTSRAGWKATAKVGADTAYAFDGEDTTRWTTNQHEGRERVRGAPASADGSRRSSLGARRPRRLFAVAAVARGLAARGLDSLFRGGDDLSRDSVSPGASLRAAAGSRDQADPHEACVAIGRTRRHGGARPTLSAL